MPFLVKLVNLALNLNSRNLKTGLAWITKFTSKKRNVAVLEWQKLCPWLDKFGD